MKHMEQSNMTAVEWFYQQIVIEGKTNYYELLEQAKIMEETHIRMAWTDGHALGKNGLVVVDYSNSREYYNKNYKKV